MLFQKTNPLDFFKKNQKSIIIQKIPKNTENVIVEGLLAAKLITTKKIGKKWQSMI